MSHDQSPRPKYSGNNRVSIAEMCCVVVILGVVVVSLVNVSRQPKIGSSRACVSNVKQISLSAIMYAGDWDDVLPAKSWMDLELPYTKNDAVNHCPDIVTPATGVYGYAMNQATVGVKSTSFRHPEQQPMIFDSVVTGRNEVGGTWLLPSPGRRAGSNTIGLVDGHAKRIPNP